MIAALDATPLTVPTGGVTRYTWELARALAAGIRETNIGCCPTSRSDTGSDSANLHKGNGPRTLLNGGGGYGGLTGK